jgi:hypothetical protein
MYRPCFWPENQRFHKNQPKILIFNPNLAYFQLVLWVVSENSRCVDEGKDSHVFEVSCRN